MEDSALFVAPHAGAWIETSRRIRHGIKTLRSLPTRERGLKLILVERQRGRDVSLPTRERGLKLRRDQIDMAVDLVAPHAGAWIETR